MCGLGQNKGSGIRGVVLVKIREWYKGCGLGQNKGVV